MRITIVARVDHVDRFFQYQHPRQYHQPTQEILHELIIAHSNHISQDLYKTGCTCMFCANPHDYLINCARRVEQDEDDTDTIFIKNLPIVCCRYCVWKLPLALHLYDRINGYIHIPSTWTPPHLLTYLATCESLLTLCEEKSPQPQAVLMS